MGEEGQGEEATWFSEVWDCGWGMSSTHSPSVYHFCLILRANRDVIPQDLEQIEEWNEFGELRMVVNKVEDLDSFPASSTTGPAADSTTTASPSTPESSAENPPKASTIKIQNPPAKETKDDSITVTMRQASEEAAAKAKGSPDTPSAKEEEPKPKPNTTETAQKEKENPPSNPPAETEEEPTKDTATQEGTEQETQNVRRKSIYPAPEIPEIEEQNGVGSQLRPPLAPGSEIAAVSSDNFRADNIEALGLVEHHRGSIISATPEEERDRVARDLRQSVSGTRADANEALRHVQAESVVDEDGDTVGGKDGVNMEAKMAVSTYLVT